MKRISIIASRGAAMLIFFSLLLFLIAPYLLNSFLLPKILAENDLKGVKLQVSHLTPWSCTSNITVGKDEANDISIAHIQANFTPFDLIRGKVQSVVLDGVTIRLTLIEGKFSLRTFTLPTANQTNKNTVSALPTLPFMVETLTLNNCHLLIERPDQNDISVTFYSTAHLNFRKTATNSYLLSDLEAKILSEGILQASLLLDLQSVTNQHRLTLEATIPKLASLTALLDLPESTRMHGQAHLTAEIEFSDDFNSINGFATQLTFPDLEISANAFATSNNPQTPLQLSIHGNMDQLEYELVNVHLASPKEIDTFMRGTVDLVAHTVNGSGEIQAEGFKDPIFLELQGSYTSSDSHLILKAKGNEQQFKSEETALSLGPYTITSELHLTPESKRISHKSEIASLHVPQHELQFKTITSHLSYVLGENILQNTEPGAFSIGTIQFKNEDVAGLSAEIQQTAEGIEFLGTLTSHKLKSLQLQIEGSSTPATPFMCKLTLPASHMSKDSFPSFISLPPGLDLSGEIQATADISFTDNLLHGSLKAQLRDGSLKLKDKNISLSGVATEINLPQLPKVFSSPKQELLIKSIEIGNIKFSDGRIAFRIEDEQTLFIEKSRFTWCNGKVESGSLHISLVNPELSTTLYCDRLQFSELLSQLGISQTEGDGSLNGRLPLHFTGKEMIFDDGFLFSTPGNSGIVRFGNTEMLRQGMPDIGQTAYLDYSIQAMENFSYNWTKLTFNSTGDDLLISMQIDGKPATPLPFGYQTGQLAPQAQGAGIQHPIRLDVNFHLPFNEMFKYGQNLQKIMENMQ
jgi:hypothetical protein